MKIFAFFRFFGLFLLGFSLVQAEGKPIQLENSSQTPAGHLLSQLKNSSQVQVGSSPMKDSSKAKASYAQVTHSSQDQQSYSQLQAKKVFQNQVTEARTMASLTVRGVDVLQRFSEIDKELKALKETHSHRINSNKSDSSFSSKDNSINSNKFDFSSSSKETSLKSNKSPSHFFNKSNPNISVNLLLLGKKTFSGEESESDSSSQKAPHDHIREGLSIQEVEFYFQSNIDPFWSGTISFGIFPTAHGGDETTGNNLLSFSPSTAKALNLNAQSPAFEMELEEAYIESLFIPSFTVKSGLFYATLGRHNSLHTHHYPFIDTPLANKKIFEGDHGFRETGLSLAYLSPLPWYSEIIGQAFYTYEDKKNPLSGLLFFKNLWDLYDNSTLEFNISYANQLNNFEHLFNSALVLKWRALSSNSQSLSWTTETILATQKESVKNIIGAHSYIQWQFLKNWHLQFRADALMPEGWNRDRERQKYSTLLSFAPTEYSALRLQGDIEKSEQGKWSYGLSIQTNMSLGAHPAHLY